ncbi:MAG: PrgI family protein [bacterium]|nr:PrgI family protein [bacterium]
MPLQFTVPQFIDVEDKIFGPISVRQFVVVMGGGFVLVAEYFILPFVAFMFFGLITAGLIALFAFFKINGQFFHIFLLNLATTIVRPKLKLWDKTVSDAEISDADDLAENDGGRPAAQKRTPSRSRLQELSLIVDTGGAYGEESWELGRSDKDIL